MLSSRLYVVTSPAIATHVQKTSKTISFNRVMVPMLKRMIGLDGEPLDMLKRELDMEHPMLEWEHDMTYKTLGPGVELDELTSRMMVQLTEFMAKALPEGGKPLDTDLFLFTREVITHCTAHAFFGPEHPVVKRQDLRDAFWDWDGDMTGLLMGPFPSVFARKSYRAREALAVANRDYIRLGHYRDAAPLHRKRVEMNHDRGMDDEAVGRGELGLLFAGLANSSRAAFWTASQVFARPDLLAEIRAEIEENAVEEGPGSSERRISVNALRARCPLLWSANREALRLASPFNATRVISDDTLVAGEYLLKKGSVVIIPASIIHADAAVWGSDATQFNPRRFLSDSTGTIAGTDKPVHPHAFRSFGGGSVFCPGRHFAQLEIVGTAAALFCGFDVTSPGGGAIPASDFVPKKMPIALEVPRDPTPVTITRRTGMENVDWVLTL